MQGMLLRIFAAISLVLGLVGCGANGTGGTTVAGGGTGGTGISVGVITAVEPVSTSSSSTTRANIFVNGVKFTVDRSTEIQKDDARATIDDLFDGLVVEVYGTISGTTGQANKVVTKDIVRGVIESNDGVNTIVVAGQTIVIDDLTIFNPPEENPASPSPPAGDEGGINDPKLAVGQFIEAYGLLRGPGTISARYFEGKSVSPATAPTTKVRGIVSNINGTTFNIGNLPVVVNSMTVVSIPGGIRNGLFVEIEGTCNATIPSPCGTLTAKTVNLEALDRTSAPWAQVEGFVTSTATSGPFTVGSQTVVLTSSTEFLGGMVSDIAVGVRLEVDGTLSHNVLTATKVIFKDNVRLEADIASVDIGTGSLTLTGLSSITVKTNNETALTDRSGGGAIALSDLAPGNHVRLRGRALDATTVLATQLERTSTSTDDHIVLQGPVQAFTGVSPTSVQILGVTVGTDNGVVFEDMQDNPIDAMTFFDSLHIGDIVKVKGTFSSSITWQEIELDN